ncbi:MAG: metallophosphoesterase [Synergistaceae bacterium]|nr:metallophosphoesterase [Synergistaceae bacterium]
MHCYVYWKIRVLFARHIRTWTSAYFALSALLLGFPLLLGYGVFDPEARYSEIMFAVSITDYVVIAMTASYLALTDVARICLGLWDLRRKTNLESRITARGAAVFALAAMLATAFYGCFEAWNVRRADVLIQTDKLPPGIERVRIVQISDVHIGGLYYASHLEKIMKIVREAEPDIFVVTGDLVDGNMEWRSRESELLASHGAKYGAFAVTGNHEYYHDLGQAIVFIKQSGLTLLENEAAEAGGIAIAGLDDHMTIWPPLLDVPGDRFVLLLKHHPQIPRGVEGKFDLQLCGHTHGGQVWLCNLAMKRVYGMEQGLSRHGGSFVYVSNGTGFWGPPLRIFAPPEVTVIDLVRE